MKTRINISLDKETRELFDKLVNQLHTTHSQFVTDIIWETFLSNEKQVITFPLVNQEGYNKTTNN